MASRSRIEEWLDDLCVRFIINLPRADLSTIARICFQIEEAQWFYEDFIRARDPKLPSMTLRLFCLRMFQHCPLLAFFSKEDRTKAFEEFLHYKTRVPVRGAIMLNQTADSVVLVKGWKKGARWSFPRGKINKDELDLDCAIREVFEETGLNLRAAGLVPPEQDLQFIEISLRDQQFRLYIFCDIPMNTVFMPQARKEISKVQWYKLSELPSLNTKDLIVHNNESNKYYLVTPFLLPLRSWIISQKKVRGQCVSIESTKEHCLINRKSMVDPPLTDQSHADQRNETTECLSSWAQRDENEETQVHLGVIVTPECTSKSPALPLLQEDKGRSLLTVLQRKELSHSHREFLPKLHVCSNAPNSPTLTLDKSLQQSFSQSSMRVQAQSADDTRLPFPMQLPELIQKNSIPPWRMDWKQGNESQHDTTETLSLATTHAPTGVRNQDLGFCSSVEYISPFLRNTIPNHRQNFLDIEPATRSSLMGANYVSSSRRMKQENALVAQHPAIHLLSNHHEMSRITNTSTSPRHCSVKSGAELCTERKVSYRGDCAIEAKVLPSDRDHSFSKLTKSSLYPTLTEIQRENLSICPYNSSEVERNASNSKMRKTSSLNREVDREESSGFTTLSVPAEVPVPSQRFKLLSLFNVRNLRKEYPHEGHLRIPEFITKGSRVNRYRSTLQPPLPARQADKSVSHTEQIKLLGILEETLANATHI